MSDTGWLILIGSGTLVFNFVGAIIAGTWVLARSNEKLLDRIEEKFVAERIATNDNINKLNENFTSQLSKLDQEIENTRSWFGENMTAIRAKITETELWNRDNFTSKDTFKVVISELKIFLGRLEDKIDLRFDKMDERLETRIREGK